VRSDRGSASLLVLSLAGVLALVAMLAVAAGSVAVARHRAASAADLAALAGADRSLQGPGPVCAAATRAAERVAAELTACRLAGDVVEVVVTVRPPGPLGALGSARAVARAGPTAPRPGTNRPPGASRL
jgi:secretion/DNA translocation related TadE-like protein